METNIKKKYDMIEKLEKLKEQMSDNNSEKSNCGTCVDINKN